MLIDDIQITVKAGSGGNGAATFRRTAQTTKGGPDGGNGGNGGNVYFQGVNDMLELQQFQYKKLITAEDGVKGAKQNLYGRNGKDTVIQIPIGTIIVDEETQEQWEVLDESSSVLLAKGGRGGRGNNEFKTATNQTPTFAEKGQSGQERKLHLVLKLIADIGFIGLPNAGKSSLLSVLTNAHPKIGNYPFTTLEPNLGVMNGLILADIPGLIEGAHVGKGLGIKFLKHVEKTKYLIHCIDSTSEHIAADYETVRKELALYSSVLKEKEEVILLTKQDLVPQEKIAEEKKKLKKFGKEIITVSIYDDEQIQALKNELQKRFS